MSQADLRRREHAGNIMDPLAYCTNLSNATIHLCVHAVESWQGIITALQYTVSQLRSALIRTLELQLYLARPERNDPGVSLHSDNEFKDVDLSPIQETITRPLFDSLTTATVAVGRSPSLEAGEEGEEKPEGSGSQEGALEERPKKTVPPKQDEFIWQWKVGLCLVFICNTLINICSLLA